MTHWHFGGKDGSADSGTFNIVIAAESLGIARGIAKQYILSKKRSDLFDTMKFISKREEPIIYTDIENGP